MRLSELMAAILIFLIACMLFSSVFINVRRNIVRTEDYSRRARTVLDIDASIRKEIQKIQVPYWKKFEKEFEKQRISLEESLRASGVKKGFEIKEVSSVCDKKRKYEGIEIEWMFSGKNYICREFIRPGIIYE